MIIDRHLIIGTPESLASAKIILIGYCANNDKLVNKIESVKSQVVLSYLWRKFYHSTLKK